MQFIAQLSESQATGYGMVAGIVKTAVFLLVVLGFRWVIKGGHPLTRREISILWKWGIAIGLILAWSIWLWNGGLDR